MSLFCRRCCVEWGFVFYRRYLTITSHLEGRKWGKNENKCGCCGMFRKYIPFGALEIRYLFFGGKGGIQHRRGKRKLFMSQRQSVSGFCISFPRMWHKSINFLRKRQCIFVGSLSECLISSQQMRIVSNKEFNYNVVPFGYSFFPF